MNNYTYNKWHYNKIYEDSYWYNTHKNPDNIEDVQELEKQIVALSYEEYKKYKDGL